MITAWQTPLGDLAEERLVRFGRVRFAVSVAIIEDATGIHVEARFRRTLIARIDCGGRDGNLPRRLGAGIDKALASAGRELDRAMEELGTR